MANKISSATKVVIPCRISFANIFEAKSINGGEAKYSVSCLIPKEDKKTLLAIHKAVEAAKEDGKTRKWGGKIPPNLKLPLRDGDIDRPDDENYQEHFFVNATFTKGTIEFRLFQFADPADGKRNGLHAGEMKAYIQLCLAMSQLAKMVRTASPKPQQTDNDKYAMRCWMLRLGFIGEEFATAREILLRNMEGNAAWRNK